VPICSPGRRRRDLHPNAGRDDLHAHHRCARSTIAATDSTRAITTQYSFEPYGKTTQTGAANANSQKFTGREVEGPHVLLPGAYYNPTYGRFVAEDPIGIASGPNGYAYVNGDPISLNDR